MMFKINFLVVWRNFMHQKLFSTINVFGLAIGIACCLLIFLFVRQEWSYDQFHANADHIYRVLSEIKAPDGSKRIVAIEPLPLANALQDEFPEVIRAVRFSASKGEVRYQSKVFTERLLFADPGIFEMFSF
ncbi:MAG: ABC transporter permease, partial [bacterium]